MNRRFAELDVLRGLAVIGMIVFHAFFILDFYGVRESDLRSGIWHGFGQVVRYLFLGLVGIGMAISYKRFLAGGVGRSGLWRKWQGMRWQWRRAILVFASGMLVSLATVIFLPEAYVRFGILHLIGLGIFVLSFLMWNRWLVLVFAIFSFWLGYFGNLESLDFLRVDSYRAIDYFPVFPWIGVVALGIFLGYFLYPNGQSKFHFDFANPLFKPVLFLGRHSLLVYLLHVPILVALFVLLRIMSLAQLVA